MASLVAFGLGNEEKIGGAERRLVGLLHRVFEARFFLHRAGHDPHVGLHLLRRHWAAEGPREKRAEKSGRIDERLLARHGLERPRFFFLGNLSVLRTTTQAGPLPQRLSFRQYEPVISRETLDRQIAKERLVTSRWPLLEERALDLEPVERDAGAGIDRARSFRVVGKPPGVFLEAGWRADIEDQLLVHVEPAGVFVYPAFERRSVEQPEPTLRRMNEPRAIRRLPDGEHERLVAVWWLDRAAIPPEAPG